MGGAAPRQEVLNCVREQAEQARKSRPEISISPQASALVPTF